MAIPGDKARIRAIRTLVENWALPFPFAEDVYTLSDYSLVRSEKALSSARGLGHSGWAVILLHHWYTENEMLKGIAKC